MADAALGFLLQNLKQLVEHNANLIQGVKREVESLFNDLSFFKAFLKDSTEKRNKNDVVKELVGQIRDVVYEAEDAIETYVAQRLVHKSRYLIEKALHIVDYPAKLRDLATDIGKIRAKVKDIYEKKKFGFVNQDGNASQAGPKEKKDPVVEEDNVVGFDGEAENVINLLNEESKDLQVISIVGMPGLGKTTLAKMIYRDSRIEFNFCNRAWVYVSQEYTRKEVFLAIFSNFIQVTDKMRNTEGQTLAKELCEFLEKSRYLIVMDDVWTEDAWNDLKIAFPKNNKQSRILITSRAHKVARIANPSKEPYALRLLTPEESWTLLQIKALGSDTSCPVELMEEGKHIAKECGGLPLAIVVIGGILLEKGIDWWGKVAKCVEAYLALDPEERIDKVVDLSYNHLPYHLKSCFIYFGMFPEDFEIPVWKLVRLWIAEGFIQQNKSLSLEDIAEEYLDDLVHRNLVMAGNRRLNGHLKTCHIHDVLHEFCMKTAAEENFFSSIRSFDQNTYATRNPALDRYRRLCIHSHVVNYISSKPVGPRVRSFLCFAAPLENTNIDPEHVSSVLVSFKLLRVLDAQPIRFSHFPRDLTQLVHLKYISLSSSFKIIPSGLSSLWNIQTLLVDTSSRTLEIKADIWKMIQLRHVKTEASVTLPKPRKSKDDKMANSSLQTLSMISPESCTNDVFGKAPNLKSLGVRGHLSKLLESKGGNLLFDSLGKLNHLENLKLRNDCFPSAPSAGKLAMLPMKNKFPPTLKKLTLSGTLLDWKEMSVLGMLDYLEILKLKDNAFEGKCWQPEDGGFRKLQVLRVDRTNLVDWRASDHHFPILKRLFLKECTNLENFPTDFDKISSLELIDLNHTTKAATEAARSIQEKKKNQRTRGGGFKLSIYPPDM